MNTLRDQLSSTFAALADPTRRAILGRLAEGEANVNELAEPFPISVQAVSQHLKVLEQAGLITRGRARSCGHPGCEGARLKDAADWLERVPSLLGWQLRPARRAAEAA